VIYRHCFSTSLEYAIRRVQVTEDGLKLNCTLQLLVSADDNILGRSIHTIEKNPETLVVASKEINPYPTNVAYKWSS
jgi:hypothetical protein